MNPDPHAEFHIQAGVQVESEMSRRRSTIKELESTKASVSDPNPGRKINEVRASIHKGTLRKKTDLKTDSFLLLFTDVLFGAFGRLPNFFTNRSFYNNTATHVGGGGC